jgi:hypothetical protein
MEPEKERLSKPIIADSETNASLKHLIPELVKNET